jgi:tetratricopeptide (TPR) repeat protein
MRVVAVALILAVALSAQADNKDVARDAFQEGSRQYEMGDFKAALAAFKRAYLNYEDPAFLFNIAQCERAIGDKPEALRTYRVFLYKVPDSPQRASVEKIVAELQAALDQEKAAAAHPPTGTIGPGASGAAPAPTDPPPASTTTSATSLTTSAEHPDRPLHKKGWFWGVVAGGAIVVAGAVTLGVVLGGRHNDYTQLVY